MLNSAAALEFVEPRQPELRVVHPRPVTIVEIGQKAAREAQRAALTETLKGCGWSLASTAVVLSMTDHSNVRRALCLLAPELYEAHRDEIQRAPRIDVQPAAQSFAEIGTAARDAAMRSHALAVAAQARWNLSEAARLAGVQMPSLSRLMQRLAPVELEAARRAGFVTRGNRTKG